MTDYFMISFMIWSMILWFSWFMSGAHQIWWAPVYVIYDKVNSTRKKCQQKGKLTPFTWTTECTMFTPPPPKKKKKKKIGSNHCFQFLLGITVISGEIEDNGYAQGALWSMWKWWIYSLMVENFGFFVYPKWHKIQLLLQRLEVTFKNASNVTWLTWTWPL